MMKLNIKRGDVDWIPRAMGDSADYLYIIFKCKNNCKTLFTYESLVEMRQLVGNITDYDMWPKICIRDGTYSKEDA
jgi:hypothetical protein